jgi:hypothetical protein
VIGPVGRCGSAQAPCLKSAKKPDHWFGDQVALEALVRFSDEELKHQALFRRIELARITVVTPFRGPAIGP